jgi:transposase
LRRLARKSKGSGQARRLLALAEIYDGSSHGEAAQVGGVTLQSIRDWVLRFNSQGPEGLIDIKSPGSKLSDERRRALSQCLQRTIARDQLAPEVAAG